MLERLHANLLRQEKALEYLKTLLEEEFTYLKAQDPQAVVSTEFCIHELLRQIARERVELKRISVQLSPESRTVRDLLRNVEAEGEGELTRTFERADALEQSVAVLAERNAYLARALLEQSRGLLEFLHKEIQPKKGNTYSSGGRYSKSRPDASIMSGRT